MGRTCTERKVGSTFRKGGTVLEVVRSDRPVCDGCYYEKNGGSKRDCIYTDNLGECRQLLRSDNNNVIFKPIKKEER